jgi:hypothetical protein
LFRCAISPPTGTPPPSRAAFRPVHPAKPRLLPLPQGRGSPLSADLCRHLLEGSVCQTLRPQDATAGCRPAQRSRRTVVLRQLRHSALTRADRSGHRVLRQPGASSIRALSGGGSASTICPHCVQRFSRLAIIDAVAVLACRGLLLPLTRAMDLQAGAVYQHGHRVPLGHAGAMRTTSIAARRFPVPLLPQPCKRLSM